MVQAERQFSWDRQQSCLPAHVAHIKREEDILRAVDQAQTSGLQTRVCGRHFSYSPLVLPDDGSLVLDMTSYNQVVAIEAPNESGGGHVVAQAGCRLIDLQQVLLTLTLNTSAQTALYNSSV